MALTPQQLAEADQAFKAVLDNFPPYWRSMFVKLVEEGFTEDQAMQILKVYVYAQTRSN